MLDVRALCKPELEQNVLGGLILTYGKAWDDIVDIISTDDFYLMEHRIIFNAICFLVHQNKPIDWIILADHLNASNELDKVGGEKYLVELMKGTATSANIRHYATLLKQSANDRHLFNAAHQILNLVTNEEEGRLDTAQKLILNIAENKTNEPAALKEFLPEVFSKLIDRSMDEDRTLGLSTGFDRLDSFTYGLRPQNLIILAARPAMGKTQLVLNIAEHLTFNLNKTVLFFSMEMSKDELGERLLSSLSQLSADKIKTGKFTEQECTALSNAYSLTAAVNFIIDDNPSLSILDISAKCRKIKRKYKGLDLVIVDYLQLIKGTEGENETIKLGYISRGLKQIAKELNVPVIALCQLNREIERRSDRRPLMSDIRQSGNIEQDADCILFLDRKEVYDDMAPKGIADIYIGKNRHGRIGQINLKFNGEYCRFDNLSASYVPIATHSNPKKNITKSFYDND